LVIFVGIWVGVWIRVLFRVWVRVRGWFRVWFRVRVRIKSSNKSALAQRSRSLDRHPEYMEKFRVTSAPVVYHYKIINS
jgi:hypothetical protein